MHTHYDNLKVARNAPHVVIKAAYRALSQLYHPDRNSHPDAVRVMKILNDAWAVLGDAETRAAYDRALATEEAEEQSRRVGPQRAAVPPEPNHTTDGRRVKAEPGPEPSSDQLRPVGIGRRPRRHLRRIKVAYWQRQTNSKPSWGQIFTATSLSVGFAGAAKLWSDFAESIGAHSVLLAVVGLGFALAAAGYGATSWWRLFQRRWWLAIGISCASVIVSLGLRS